MAAVLQWLEQNQEPLAWLGALSLLTFFISLLTLPWLVARIPEDYFLSKRRQPTDWKQEKPLVRSLLLVGKNILGGILLCGGFLMLFVPGQGLLTIAMGLLLMDYPGKFKLERRIVSMPATLNSLNWLRAKTNNPPLRMD